MAETIIVDHRLPMLLLQAGLSNAGNIDEAMNTLLQIVGYGGTAKVLFINVDVNGDLIVICAHPQYQELTWCGVGRGWVGMKTGVLDSAEQIRVEFYHPRLITHFG